MISCAKFGPVLLFCGRLLSGIKDNKNPFIATQYLHVLLLLHVS